MKKSLLMIPAMVSIIACNDGNNDQQNNNSSTDSNTVSAKGSYAFDAEFLKKHTKQVHELVSPDGQSKVLLSSDYQGRVMTSSAKGDSGASFGWLNYDLISSGLKKPQFNPVGGEERFWLGPEGGQYSVYFKGKDSFSFDKWQVPPVIDTLAFELKSADKSSAWYFKKTSLVNYSGHKFDFDIDRKISLLDKAAMSQALGADVDASLSAVAYETDNSITNNGSENWSKKNGLLSIWLLAMLTPTDQTKVIIPFDGGKQAAAKITSDYFGPVPADRLVIKDNYLLLTCDGKYRSKIGIHPSIAKPIAGSFDFGKNILTITKFSVDNSGTYVNSKWELQKDPFSGDAVNAYNDGPLADGSQMGPFYEIESSSAAKELKPGESQQYKQTTFHFQGDYVILEALALKVLGVRLADVK